MFGYVLSSVVIVDADARGVSQRARPRFGYFINAELVEMGINSQ